VDRVSGGIARLRIAHDGGAALVAVLVIALIVGGSSALFIAFMQRQQSQAGARYRSAEALAVAEAGVHRALSTLEGDASGGAPRGRFWRPDGYLETVAVGTREGRFTLSISDAPDGALVIASAGEFAGTVRRLRVHVYISTPALLAALYGAGFVHLERPPAAVTILPYGAGIRDRPWIHVAAGTGIGFETTDVSINDPSVRFEAGPGPIDAPGAGGSTMVRAPGPARLLLAKGADLTLGPERRRVDIDQLRVAGVYVAGVVEHADVIPEPPGVDRGYYQAAAASNAANRIVNEAAGRRFADADLQRKAGSLYTPEQFERVLQYVHQTKAGPVRGLIYVTGGVSLNDGEQLEVADGALVAESTVYLGQKSAIEVTHSAGTRTLPGLVILDDGALVLTRGARLRAHGLVYVNRMIDLGKDTRVDIVGALLGNDPELSVRSFASSVVIRYDPAVLGTRGLRPNDGARPITWVAAWEELP
jgi:hypothetical protein